MIASRLVIIMSFVSIVLFPGCSSNLKYPSRRLTPLSQSKAHSSRTKHGVTVSVESFDADKQLYYFAKETPRLHPIQIAVDNSSDTTWLLHPDNINLPLARYSTVTKYYKANPWTSVGLGIVLLPVGLTHGVLSYCANRIIETDINEKMLNDEAYIEPDVQHNSLIFANSQSELDHFNITLVDADDPSHTLIFNLGA